MLCSINTISVFEVTWKTGLKKALKASQLVNVNSKELLYFKRAHFKGFFLLASIPNQSMNLILGLEKNYASSFCLSSKRSSTFRLKT